MWAEFGRRPVLGWTLAAFESCGAVDEVVVVAGAARVEDVEQLVAREGFGKVVRVVAGGSERHESVWNGLRALGDAAGVVAVHDAARPLVTAGAIGRCVVAAAESGAAVLAHRVVETVKRDDGDGCVGQAVERDGLWAMETPQAFRRELLVRAYELVRARGEVVTDEVSALQALGEKVVLLENLEPNLKVTVEGDLEMLKRWELKS